MRSDLKPWRMICLVAATALVASAAAAGVALAARPEFSTTKVKLTGTSGTTKLVVEGGGVVITCQTSSSDGEVVTKTEVNGIKLTFKACGAGHPVKCAVHSPGETDEIVTNTLKGILGSVKASEAATEAGLLLEPSSGTLIAKLEGTCLVPTTTSLEGSVAGEVAPINRNQTTGKLVLAAVGGVQKIKTIVTTSTVKPRLEAFAEEAAEEMSESIAFGAPLEVT